MKHSKVIVVAMLGVAAVTFYLWPKNRAQVVMPQAEKSAFPTSAQLSKAELMKARNTAATDLKAGRAPAASANVPEAAAPTSSVRQTLQSLPRSEELLVNKLPRRILLARAIPKSRYSSAMGLSVMEQNGFVIVPQTASTQEWKQIIVNRNDKPVLFNPESHQIPEIVTGTLVLELTSVHQAAALAARQNLKLMHTEPRISRAYFQVPEGFALMPGLKAIEQDPSVKSIEVETLHGKLEAR